MPNRLPQSEKGNREACDGLPPDNPRLQFTPSVVDRDPAILAIERGIAELVQLGGTTRRSEHYHVTDSGSSFPAIHGAGETSRRGTPAISAEALSQRLDHRLETEGVRRDKTEPTTVSDILICGAVDASPDDHLRVVHHHSRMGEMSLFQASCSVFASPSDVAEVLSLNCENFVEIEIEKFQPKASVLRAAAEFRIWGTTPLAPRTYRATSAG